MNECYQWLPAMAIFIHVQLVTNRATSGQFIANGKSELPMEVQRLIASDICDAVIVDKITGHQLHPKRLWQRSGTIGYDRY